MAAPVNEPIRRRHGYPLKDLYLSSRRRVSFKQPVVGSGALAKVLGTATVVSTAALAIRASLAATLAQATLASAPFAGVPGARVVITETWGNPSVTIAKVEFLTGTTPLAGTPIFSTQNSSTTPATAAFDADANSYWQPTIGDPAPSIGLNFPSPAIVDAVRVTFKPADALNVESAPKSFRIEVTDDGVVWTTKLVVTNEAAWTSGEIRTYQINAAPPPPPPPPGTAVNYARIVFTETWGNPAVSIARAEFLEGSTLRTGTTIFSTQNSATTPAAHAFDTDANTYWQPTIGDPEPSIGLQFAAPTAFNTVRLTFKPADAPNVESAPKSFRIETSDNGTAWTTRLTVTNEAAWTAGEVRSYAIP